MLWIGNQGKALMIGCDQTLKVIGRSDQLKSAVAMKNRLVGLYD